MSANSTQTSFLGGEWSTQAQGNVKDPKYAAALALCSNAYPTEDDAVMRRPGFFELGCTYYGETASTSVQFELPSGTSAYLEETFHSSHVYFRFWCENFLPSNYVAGPFILLPDDIVGISAISSDDPAKVTLSSAKSWTTGDIVMIYADQSSGLNAPTLTNRQLKITVVDSTHFTIQDMVTGANIDGSALAYTGGTSYVAHIATVQTGYTSANDLTGSASLIGLRIIQTGQEAFLVSANYEPTVLSFGAAFTATGGQTIPFTFSVAQAGFVSTTSNTWDGPYLDALPGASQTGNSLGSVAHVSGDTYTFTNTDSVYTFSSADVGKQIRVWIQPAAFDPSTSYSNGDTVTYDSAYYVMTQSGVAAGTIPGQSVEINSVYLSPWVPQPTLGGWKAGVISADVDGSNVTVKLNLGAWNCTNTVVDTWQLGFFCAGTWPSCGTFHEGRLWLGGASAGRFDASYTNWLSNATPGFQATDYYGEVTDANAISETLNTPPQSRMVWMVTDTTGVIAATNIDEWLISAPESNGAISPDNIQARRISRYGSAPIEPLRVGLAIIFVQAQQRQLIEYVVDPFGNHFVGWRLNTKAKHLTAD